ncbi:DUF4124 domain-containing protein [Dyella solisilvae]|uniref:DUF4124 domain-containing protein n=1 Tax=Dyella solisilvae TaxID=1920168 RepID=A0A370K716_9GAMM|nr:DUF4124 domain-containing protein [Dyella solisilvae]RDI98423.1 DUF4124 domain-containing protein [Dyella solisilvae]
MIRYGLALLLLLPMGVRAQDVIHRCVSADGHPVFTDQPCAALQATPVADPREAPAPPAATEASASPPPVSCSTTVADLRQGVLDAFASRDPNRLAGLMLWSGYGRNAVVADIRSLGGLMQHPLLDVDDDVEPAPAPPSSSDLTRLPDAPVASPPPNTSGERQLVVRTAAEDGSGVARETRFSVVRRSGCLWLRGSG